MTGDAPSDSKRKERARTEVRLALDSGRLEKAEACADCGKATTELDAHHGDYDRPLDVEWLCDPCHHDRHPNEGRPRSGVPEPPKIVGRNIKAAREAAGLTQEQLAQRAGMLTHEISRYERGVRDLRISTLARVAAGLDGVTPADLLRGV